MDFCCNLYLYYSQPNMNHLLDKCYLTRSLASLEESSEIQYIEPKPLKYWYQDGQQP